MRIAVIALALLSLGLAACGGDDYKTRKPVSTTKKKKNLRPPLTDKEGQEMIDFRCTKCHSPSPIRKSKNTLAQWEEQLRSCVQGGKGARLSPVQQTSLAEWLAKTYGP